MSTTRPMDAKLRFGVRRQLVALFTLAFTAVFAAVFFWVYSFVTHHTTDRLQTDLNQTLTGSVSLLDGDELAALYRGGARNAAGLSDDPRFKHVLDQLALIHQIEPRAYPYTFVRGDEADTRRAGPRAPSPECVWLVDYSATDNRANAATFLESDTCSRESSIVFERNVLVDRGYHRDRFGTFLTSYAPIRDRAGHVVAVLGIDFQGSYVEQVQHDVQIWIALVFAGSYLALVLLVYFAANLFTRPVVELTAAAEQLRDISRGNSADRRAVGSTIQARRDELGALARAFNRMAERLAGAFRELENANVDLEHRVEQRTSELVEEQAKSERLLRNVLPAEIAERLKHNPEAIAEGYDAVAVMFADIVGFTELSAREPPIKVVALLNEVFSAFDQLADQLGLEKIKTIGDAYMVVGGLPNPRPDAAIAIAYMALDMLDVMHELAETHVGLSIRVGIHTGSVIAGVLGTKKLSYDLWGDTVNIASRMESHGAPGKIQISEQAAEALRECFQIEERGTIHLKGRGEQRTFWLLGRKQVAG